MTYFNYVGKPLSYILATPARPDDADNTLVRVFGNEGAEADIVAFGQRFGCVVVDSYGSTEGGATVQRTPDTPRGRAGEGTRGDDGSSTPSPDDRARRRASTTTACCSTPRRPWASWSRPKGAAGFEGYWHNDEAELARLRNGWYWTGDLAYRDEAGFFYFAGRSDDWLRVDGENFVAPPVARIMDATPTSCSPRCTPCPIPSWGTR